MTNPGSGGLVPGNGSQDPHRQTPNTDSNLVVDSTDYWSQYPGSSVELIPESLGVFNEYVAVRPLNQPSNFRIYFDLKQSQPNRWGGYVVIGYRDNGQIYSAQFSTMHPHGRTHNQVSYKDWYKDLPQSEFNQWFQVQGKQVFHGFFQDAYGAIIVVFDDGLNLGDGQGITELKGSVWF
jgi:hypothetical protein